jgi:DNA-binding LacI/PurR family transcriptional regulator
VSKSLVSQVLQNNPRVSEARRAAVLMAIAELGYRPNRAATELASRRTKSIEVVIDDYSNLWFVGLLAGLRSELADHGYHLSVAETQLNAHLSRERHASILSTNLDGLVIAAELDDALLERWTGPTVIAGRRRTKVTEADVIASDDDAGGRMAAEYLLQLGHRTIGHLTGGGGPAAHRRAGFTARMAEDSLQPLVSGDDGGTSEADGYRAACVLLAGNPGMTAIFAANDTMAVGALAAVRMNGRTVPHDISVIGYDNSPLAKSVYLDLTSIDDRSEVIGAAAGRALLARFDNPSLEPRYTLVQPVLAVRSTTVQASPRA